QRWDAERGFRSVADCPPLRRRAPDPPPGLLRCAPPLHAQPRYGRGSQYRVPDAARGHRDPARQTALVGARPTVGQSDEVSCACSACATVRINSTVVVVSPIKPSVQITSLIVLLDVSEPATRRTADVTAPAAPDVATRIRFNHVSTTARSAPAYRSVLRTIRPERN